MSVEIDPEIISFDPAAIVVTRYHTLVVYEHNLADLLVRGLEKS